MLLLSDWWGTPAARDPGRCGSIRLRSSGHCLQHIAGQVGDQARAVVQLVADAAGQLQAGVGAGAGRWVAVVGIAAGARLAGGRGRRNRRGDWCDCWRERAHGAGRWRPVGTLDGPQFLFAGRGQTDQALVVLHRKALAHQVAHHAPGVDALARVAARVCLGQLFVGALARAQHRQGERNRPLGVAQGLHHRPHHVRGKCGGAALQLVNAGQWFTAAGFHGEVGHAAASRSSGKIRPA